MEIRISHSVVSLVIVIVCCINRGKFWWLIMMFNAGIYADIDVVSTV